MTKAASLRRLVSAVLLSLLPVVAACRSHHIEITVENRTGTAVKLLEVDYPSASFGADAVAAGADFHYRIQVRGSGPLSVAYTAAGGSTAQIAGPELSEGQQGRIEIVLLPAQKAEFHAELNPAQ